MKYYQRQDNVLSGKYLNDLWGEVCGCPYFTVNNLNRDFVQTKGFSIAFQRSGRAEVEEKFPFFQPYLELALLPHCNAFYLNPLLLTQGSRVDPHIDRSLRSYCKAIAPPAVVSVLYVRVPPDLEGGELILRDRKRTVAEIKPNPNTLIHFQGDLTHSVNAVKSRGSRLSLVCEQYSLSEAELWEIPRFTIESRVLTSGQKKKR